ncbi:hypothetical protein HK097_011359, partial [Rhizophlyctis rosea]
MSGWSTNWSSTAVPYLPLHPAEWSLDRWLATYGSSPTALGDWFVALHEVINLNWDYTLGTGMAHFGLERKTRAYEMFKRWRDGTDKQIYLTHHSMYQATQPMYTFAPFAQPTNTMTVGPPPAPPVSQFPPALCHFNKADTGVNFGSTQENSNSFQFGTGSNNGASSEHHVEIKKETQSWDPWPVRAKNKKKKKKGAANVQVSRVAPVKPQAKEEDRKPATVTNNRADDIPETKKQKSSDGIPETKKQKSGDTPSGMKVKMTVQKGEKVISYTYALPKREESEPIAALPSTNSVAAFTEEKQIELVPQSPGWTVLQSKRKRGGGDGGEVPHDVISSQLDTRVWPKPELDEPLNSLKEECPADGEGSPAIPGSGAVDTGTTLKVELEDGELPESENAAAGSMITAPEVLVKKPDAPHVDDFKSLENSHEGSLPGGVKVTLANVAALRPAAKSNTKKEPSATVPARSIMKKKSSEKESPFLTPVDWIPTKTRTALVESNTKGPRSVIQKDHHHPPTNSTANPAKYVPPQFRAQRPPPSHQSQIKKEPATPVSSKPSKPNPIPHQNPPLHQPPQNKENPTTPLSARPRIPSIDPIGTPCNAQSEDRAAVLAAQSKPHCGLRCTIGEKLKKSKIEIIMDRMGQACDTFVEAYLKRPVKGGPKGRSTEGDLAFKLHFIRSNFRDLPEVRGLEFGVRRKLVVLVGNGVTVRNVVSHDTGEE